MPRKTLNNDQQQVAYCLIARLRDQNYPTNTEEIILDEIFYATKLYLAASNLHTQYLNLARKEFDGVSLKQANEGKVEGIINVYNLGAKDEALKFSKFILQLIYPELKQGHTMTYLSNKSHISEIEKYFNKTISLLGFSEKFFRKFKHPYKSGMEYELLPVYKLNQDLLSRIDTFFKRIGKKIQFDEDLKEWIINRLKISSPYRYKAVFPTITSIANDVKSNINQENLSNWNDAILINYIINEYELSGHPEYILSPKKFRDRIRQNIHNFR